jgi:hypothetical protein
VPISRDFRPSASRLNQAGAIILASKTILSLPLIAQLHARITIISN